MQNNSERGIGFAVGLFLVLFIIGLVAGAVAGMAVAGNMPVSQLNAVNTAVVRGTQQVLDLNQLLQSQPTITVIQPPTSLPTATAIPQPTPTYAVAVDVTTCQATPVYKVPQVLEDQLVTVIPKGVVLNVVAKSPDGQWMKLAQHSDTFDLWVPLMTLCVQ